MDPLVVGLSIDHREELVWKLRSDLVHGECHCFNVKGSDFRAPGENI